MANRVAGGLKVIGIVLALVMGFLSPVEVRADKAASGNRSDKIYLPDNYDATKSYPFVLSLHGYGSNGKGQQWFFPLKALSNEYGFIYASPDGLRKSWNATDACCDWRDENNDSQYLRSLIEKAISDYNIDKKRIFVMGLSNGGFMSYRMAHDHADLIAGIVPFAGVGYHEWPSNPAGHVHVLNIHGTADKVIKWDGGLINEKKYPSVKDNFNKWIDFNKCRPVQASDLEIIDSTKSVVGEETKIQCWINPDKSISMQLWEIVKGPHVTPLNQSARKRVIEWMFANPKAE